jgi:hypothetical protein
MAKDFEIAIPYVREFLDVETPQYPRAIDVPLIERLDKAGYERFLGDLIKIANQEEKREDKLKDSIPRVIQASEIYDPEKAEWLLAQSYSKFP